MDLARLRAFLAPLATGLDARCLIMTLAGQAVVAFQPSTPACPARVGGREAPACPSRECPFAGRPPLSPLKDGDVTVGHLFWCTGAQRTNRKRLSEGVAALASGFVRGELELERLTSETLERFGEITLLHDLTASLSGVFDPAAAASIALARGVETLQARAAAGWLNGGGAPIATHGALPAGIDAAALATIDAPVVIDAAGPRPPGLDRAAFHSLLVAPLRVGAVTLGQLVFVDRRDGAAFSPADGRLADTLARQAAAAIHAGQLVHDVRRAEVMENELKIAHHIQETLLPATIPEVEGLELAARCLPAGNVGGDYFDLIPLGGGWLGLVVADVSGHGVGSALMLTAFRTALQMELSRDLSPARVLARINALLHRDLERAGMFVTAFLAVYEPVTGSLAYANAGHNPARQRRAATGQIVRLDATGLPVGMFADSDFEEGTLSVEPGDIVLVYTDGLVEQRGTTGQPLGEAGLDRLLQSLGDQPAEACVDTLVAAFRRHLDGAEPRDDATVVALRRVL